MAVGDTTVNLNNPLAKKGAVFDGVDDYVKVAHNANQLLTNGFTFAAWANPKSIGEVSGRILEKTVATGYKWAMVVNNRITLNVAGGSDVSSNNDSFLYNKWSYLITTVSSSSLVTHYVNGTQTGTPATTGALSGITSTAPLIIGNNNYVSPERTFDGSINNVQIYNRVLTQAEITKLSNGEIITDGLISRWKLDKDYKDSVGDNDGTNSGSYLSAVDDQVAADVSTARVTANDIIKVFPLNNKIMNVNIEEA